MEIDPLRLFTGPGRGCLHADNRDGSGFGPPLVDGDAGFLDDLSDIEVHQVLIDVEHPVKLRLARLEGLLEPKRPERVVQLVAVLDLEFRHP